MAPTRLVKAALGTALSLLFGSEAASETRVLLVGIGRYPGLDASLQMTAPAQDVRRLAASLSAAGLDPSSMTLMGEIGDEAGPDRAAVLAALSELERAARSGDRILLYFSGHGGQRPAIWPEREADGLEEIWLTADARLDADGTVVAGYLADHEIEASIRRMRAAGADVWLVVDACHAGGVTRSVGSQVKAVSSPRSATSSPDIDWKIVAEADLSNGPAAGRFAAFYAADAHSLALAGPNGSHFTNALTRALDGGRTSSLADLAAGVLAVDARLGVDAPRPVFEGDLEGTVLTLDRAGSRRFALRRDRDRLFVAAGAEEGLKAGDWIDTEDAKGQLLRPLRVATIGIGSSQLEGDADTDAVAGRIRSGRVQAETPAARLLAAIGLLGGRWSPGLKVTALLERPDPSECEVPVDPEHPGPEALPVSLTAMPPLQDCDRLFVRMENSGTAPLDVSVLYLTAEGGVVGSSLHPIDSARLRSGEERAVAFRIVSEPNEVTERIAVIAVPARSRFPLDLRYLAQSGASGAAAVRRSGQDWWSEVLTAEPHRGAPASPPTDTAIAIAFPIRVTSLTGNVRQ